MYDENIDLLFYKPVTDKKKYFGNVRFHEDLLKFKRNKTLLIKIDECMEQLYSALCEIKFNQCNNVQTLLSNICDEAMFILQNQRWRFIVAYNNCLFTQYNTITLEDLLKSNPEAVGVEKLFEALYNICELLVPKYYTYLYAYINLYFQEIYQCHTGYLIFEKNIHPLQTCYENASCFTKHLVPFVTNKSHHVFFLLNDKVMIEIEGDYFEYNAELFYKNKLSKKMNCLKK